LDADLRSSYQRAVDQRHTADRRACPSVEELEALATKSGAEQSRLTTLDHVMTCAACQQDFEMLRAIHGAGQSSRVVLAPRWYAIAAAAVLVAGVAFFTFRDSGTVMRGNSATTGGPGLVAPQGAVNLQAARRFVWRSVPNASRYRIEVLDLGGRVVASAALSDTVWQLPDSVDVRSGEELEWLVRAELPDGREERSASARVRVR
jgi:hypothetical protein